MFVNLRKVQNSNLEKRPSINNTFFNNIISRATLIKQFVMKKTQKWMISIVIMGLVTTLLSWNHYGDPGSRPRIFQKCIKSK
jgi:hypothetical protein